MENIQENITGGNGEMAKLELVLDMSLDSTSESADLMNSLETLSVLTSEVAQLRDDINNWGLQKIPAQLILQQTRRKMILIDELLFHLNKKFQKTGTELDKLVTSIHTLLSSEDEEEEIKKSSLPTENE